MLRVCSRVALAISLGISGLIVVHDVPKRSEDAHIVWVCPIMGNRVCEANQGPIQIAPINIVNW